MIAFRPGYSVAKVFRILKRISGSKIFKEFPKIKNKLWGGHFWEQVYLFTTVCEHVTDDVIRKYREQHTFSQDQLNIFE